MKDFDFISPTKIFFGKGKEKLIGKIISSYSFKKVLVHYGQNHVKKSGLLDLVLNSLKENNIEYITIGGVLPNPDISLVREVVDIIKKEKVDMILALGGGSVIDSSKLIACGYYYSGDCFDFSLKKVIPTKALPIGVILTNAASGSELSTSCVISSRKDNFKSGFNSDIIRPLFVIENPELTYSLDLHTTGCGVVDIFSHTFERYFCSSDEVEFCDYIAEGLLKAIIKSGSLLASDLNSYTLRANVEICSSFSHNGLTSIGKISSMPIHALEHQLSGYFPSISHGEGLAILIPSWMEICSSYFPSKFIKYAENVFDIDKSLPSQTKINLAIQKTKDFFSLFNLKKSLSEFNVTYLDIVKMNENIKLKKIKMFDIDSTLVYNLSMKILENCL